MNSSALINVIMDATSVRVTRVGEFDPRHRSRAKPLFVTRDPAPLARLRHYLEIDDDSFARRLFLMTPGVLDMNFLAGHELRATVSYIHSGLIRWRGWPSDALLVHPAELIAWLAEHGWQAPSL